MRHLSVIVLMLFMSLGAGGKAADPCCRAAPRTVPDGGRLTAAALADGCTTVFYEETPLPSGCVFITITAHCEFPGINVSTSCAFYSCSNGDSGTFFGQCNSFVY